MLKLATSIIFLTIVTVTATVFDNSSSNSTATNSSHPPNKNQPSLLLCSDSNFKHGYINCSQNGPLLTPGYCATYNEDKRILSLFWCQNILPNVTINGYAKLPRNLSQLNNYTCGLLHRKGHLCSECVDGFGFSVTSFGYRCVNCTGAWYGVPLFLFLEFVPITVFYFIVLVFQISMTSPPMPCFIMYAQMIVLGLNHFSTDLYLAFIDHRQHRLSEDVKIMLTLYGLFNLDFCRNNILPPFCVSNKIRPIHIALLGYFSGFYPILLIFLIWVSIELHGRNFGPLVWLWRPFHRCSVRLRRSWDTKSDIIDVFTTFFFLSYDKLFFQTLMLVQIRAVAQIDQAGKPFITYRSIFIDIHGNLGLIILSFLVLFIFNFLPPLLLTLYPISAFRSCLSKCRLNSIAITIFVEKIHGCYRNGLDGGRDMRSFSGLYFFLRMMLYFVMCLYHALGIYRISQWYLVSILLLITTLTMAFAKPYQKAFMNCMDTLLLSICTILCLTVSLNSDLRTMHMVAKILLATPFIVMVLFIILKKMANYKHLVNKFRMRRAPFCIEPPRNLSVDTPTASQSIIQPTFSILNYGTTRET